MIYNLAFSIGAATTRAGIAAFVADASSIRRTVCVDDTLRPATFIWVSYISLQAWTWPCVISFLAHSVSSTRWRRTRSSDVFYLQWCLNAVKERVSSKPIRAQAIRRMTDNPTLCIISACTFTWIFAFIVDTREMCGTLFVTCTLRSAIRSLTVVTFQASTWWCFIYFST